VCVAADLRERKKLEAELLHAGKLESIGMASGIAHEIDTPISARRRQHPFRPRGLRGAEPSHVARRGTRKRHRAVSRTPSYKPASTT
jgi:C4-dicarboxylate-specific signal transduction histidine kinase